jgi:hypothetical protein
VLTTVYNTPYTISYTFFSLKLILYQSKKAVFIYVFGKLNTVVAYRRLFFYPFKIFGIVLEQYNEMTLIW